MARKDTPVIMAQKRQLVNQAIAGRASANGASLAASFGLPIEDVRRILQSAKVKDDG